MEGLAGQEVEEEQQALLAEPLLAEPEPEPVAELEAPAAEAEEMEAEGALRPPVCCSLCAYDGG